MEKQISIWSLLIILVLTLTACRSNQTEIDTVPDHQGGEIAYPADEVEFEGSDTAYQESNAQQLDLAYPITEDDLRLLFKTWSLSTYLENDVTQEPVNKTLTFNSDGTYEITSEGTTTTGNWMSRLYAYESTLLLESDTHDDLITFEIVALNEARLELRSMQDNVIIDEIFVPAN